MKIILFILLAMVFISKATAQNKNDIPKLIGIIMIGNSNKPILDLFILDSTRKINYNFNTHTIVSYTNKKILNDIYNTFLNEKKFDTLTYHSYSFGTFLFYFEFENGKKIEVVSNPSKSILHFNKIIDNLIPNNENADQIIKAVKNNLAQINFEKKKWSESHKLIWADFESNSLSLKKLKAFTFSTIEIDYDIEDTCLNYKIETLFIPRHSWYKDTSLNLLKLEQGNFDIAEIFARKIRKLLTENILIKKDKKFILQEIKKILVNKEKYQTLYNNSKKSNFKYKMRKIWENKIANELLALKRFEQVEFSNCR